MLHASPISSSVILFPQNIFDEEYGFYHHIDSHDISEKYSLIVYNW
jgi:hypothetical protein